MNRRQLFGFIAAAPLVPVVVAAEKSTRTDSLPTYPLGKPQYTMTSTFAPMGNVTEDQMRRIKEAITESARKTKEDILKMWARNGDRL